MRGRGGEEEWDGGGRWGRGGGGRGEGQSSRVDTERGMKACRRARTYVKCQRSESRHLFNVDLINQLRTLQHAGPGLSGGLQSQSCRTQAPVECGSVVCSSVVCGSVVCSSVVCSSVVCVQWCMVQWCVFSGV